ncbi:tetraspanin-9-like [Rhododendron vialii]|uniref:tetraspanin-9-like n=1 Tax=Rhododendron vialii TaxID=182163 RepID=UPI00265E25E4|nr:tetraspanin-9-like [Rhododendron vialii]
MATMTTEEVQSVHMFFVVVSVTPMVFTGYFLVKTAIMFFSFDPDCTNAHLDWDLALGLFLFTLFLVGTLSLAWRVTALQSTCMALLLVTIAVILVASGNIIKGGTESNDSKTIEELLHSQQEYYCLETYPSWAQTFLLKDNDWHVFQKCIIDRKICENFDKEDLFQGGCCKPPIYCGFQLKNQTWLIPEAGLYSNDANCQMWSNEKGRLCYSCDTCKASYINDLSFKWYMRGGIIMSAVAVWIISFGCSYGIEMDNNRRRNRTIESAYVTA